MALPLTDRPNFDPNATDQRAPQARFAQPFLENLAQPLPTHIDGGAQSLIDGLRSINPALEQWATKESKDAYNQGVTDRNAGKALAEGFQPSPYVRGFMTMDGAVKGQQDASQLMQDYQTKFDKDSGNLDEFIAQEIGGKTSGITDQSFIDGYGQALNPAIQKLRGAHLQYQQQQVVGRVESNAMQLMDGAIRGFVDNGQPVPPDYMDGLKKTLTDNMGVDNARFQDLLFATVKNIGDAGNPAVYDMLKHDKADGSPGMYYDPAWKEKIDMAQQHATNVFLANQKSADEAMKKAREESLDKAMAPILLKATTDPTEAMKDFDTLKLSGAFDHASDVLKWQTAIGQMVDGAPTPEQVTNAAMLESRVLKGQASSREVLDAVTSHTITGGQMQWLMGQVHQVSTDNRLATAQERQAAAAELKARKLPFEYPQYQTASGYLKRLLTPRPNTLGGMSGGQVEFDRGEQASALAELDRRVSSGKHTPEEYQGIADEIAKAHMARRKLYMEGSMNPTFGISGDAASLAHGQLPYNTPQDLLKALQSGLITPWEARQQAAALGINLTGPNRAR